MRNKTNRKLVYCESFRSLDLDNEEKKKFDRYKYTKTIDKKKKKIVPTLRTHFIYKEFYTILIFENKGDEKKIKRKARPLWFVSFSYLDDKKAR